jgi:hypothetical protein
VTATHLRNRYPLSRQHTGQVLRYHSKRDADCGAKRGSACSQARPLIPEAVAHCRPNHPNNRPLQKRKAADPVRAHGASGWAQMTCVYNTTSPCRNIGIRSAKEQGNRIWCGG